MLMTTDRGLGMLDSMMGFFGMAEVEILLC